MLLRLVMNSLTLLLLLVGAATCHHSHHGWKPGHRYQYEMRGRNVAGLQDVSNQFVGLLTRGLVNVQAKSDGRVNVQIEQPEQLDVQQHLARGWKTFIPDEGANYKPLPLVSRSFDLEFQGGIVKKMWVHKEAPIYETNIFKALASLLQMDTTGENTKHNQEPKSEDYTATFKTTEDTVHGEVETLYSLSPLPLYHLQHQPSLAPKIAACPQHGMIFNVQKSLNFDHVRHLPAYHYGFSDLSEGIFGGNQMGNMLSRSVNSRAVVCGSSDNFLVQSTVTTDRVVVAPHLYNNQKGEVVSEFNLTLIHVQDSHQEPQGLSSDSKEYESLMYEYNAAESEQSAEKKSRSRRSVKNNETLWRPNTLKPDTPNNKNATVIKIHEWSNFNSSEDSSSSSSSSDSDSSKANESKSRRKDHWQPRPGLKSAPNNPLLPYFIAVAGNSIQASPKLDGVEKTENLANSIGRDMVQLDSVAHQQTLSKFSRLVSLLQTMNEDQMNKATEKLYFPLSKASQKNREDSVRYNAWVAFRDATAQAGTGPSLLTLKSWIKSCKVAWEEAAELVGTISRMAQYPSEEFIQSFYDMMISDDVSKLQQLNTSAIISFAELVRKVLVSNDTAHKRYPVHSFGRPHSKNSTLVGDKFIPHFEKKLAESMQQGESTKIQLYIWALGLISHPNVLPIFERYLERTVPATHFQRLTMIVSLNQMTRLYPKLVRPIMFKIYQNTKEEPEIRIAAVMQLMKTNPPAQILQRMSEFTNYETSKQVNSAVKSALESAAYYIDRNGNQELRERASAAVDMLTNYEYGSQYSKIFISSGAKKNVDLSYVHELTHIQSEDSVLPSSIFCSFKRQLGGFQNPPAETFFSTSSIADLWALLSSQFGGRTVAGGNKNSDVTNQTSWTYEAVARRLNIAVGTEAQVEGNIMTSLLGSKRLFTFDNHTVNQLPQLVKHAVNSGRFPKEFNMTKMYDQLNLKIAFPTAMGLPFSYSFNVPTVVAFRGQAHGKLYPDPTRSEGRTPFPKTLNASADINLLYSAMSEGKMGFVAPFNQKEYLAGLKRQVQLHLPLKLDVDLDLENSKLWWNMRPIDPKRSTKLFEYSTVPYTAIQNIIDILNPSINTEIINVRRTKKVYTSLGESLGLAFDVKMETQQEFLTWSNVYEAVRPHNYMTAILYPFAEEAVNYNNFTLIYNGPKSQAAVVKGVIKYNSWDKDTAPHQQPKNPTAMKDFDAGFDSPERENQIGWKVANGIKDATSSIIDMSVEFKGPSHDKVFIASAALGSSRVQNASQIAIFSSFGQNSKSASYKILGELTATSPLLHRINFVETLKEDSEIHLDGKLTFGKDDHMSEVKLNMNMMKSEERRQALASKPLAHQCKNQMFKNLIVQPTCRNVTGRSGQMDEYNVDITYKNLPEEIKTMSYIAYTVARYYVTDYMSEDLVGKNSAESSGRISANWKFSQKSVNISIASPAINAQFTHVPVDPLVGRQLFVIHPTYNVISRLASKFTRNQFFPICVVEGGWVNTFDNLTYPSGGLGDCWYTMAHSFSKPMKGLNYQLPSSNFSIHVRKGGSNSKEVMMVLDNNVINLYYDNDRPAMKWNNHSIRISDDRVSRFEDVNHKDVAIGYILPGNLLVVESPAYNIQLMYNGPQVILQVSNGMRGNVRGLCGNFNGEKIDDLLVPKNCIQKNSFEFASEYISGGNSCRRPHKKSSENNSDHCIYKNK